MSFFSNARSHESKSCQKIAAITLGKVGRTSNASANVTRFWTPLSLQSKFKKLLFFCKWSAGRSSKGKVVVNTRSSRKNKLRSAFITYNFRRSSLFFIGGVNYLSHSSKATSIVFNSCGMVSYIPFSLAHGLFLLYKLNSPLSKKYVGRSGSLFMAFHREILKVNYLIFQQKKNVPVSFLELTPLGGVQYTRSLGSKALIKKMDTRTGLALIILSSGLKKVFSIYSQASPGCAMLPFFKKSRKNTKFGYYAGFGKKPKVRGVAKNPVDHPHGGKTHAIRYPRTPWGKTTKFK